MQPLFTEGFPFSQFNSILALKKIHTFDDLYLSCKSVLLAYFCKYFTVKAS